MNSKIIFFKSSTKVLINENSPDRNAIEITASFRDVDNERKITTRIRPVYKDKTDSKDPSRDCNEPINISSRNKKAPNHPPV